MLAPPATDMELSAYVDGELPPRRRADIEAWLATTPRAAKRVAAFRLQNEMLRAHFARRPASGPALPPVQGATPRDAAAEPLRWPPPARIPRGETPGRLMLVSVGSFFTGAGVALAVVTLLGYAPAFLSGARMISAMPLNAIHVADPARALSDRAVAMHETFAFDPGRPVEYPASAPDMAAQLSRRAGFTVRPPDLSGAGFRLLGGRVAPAEAGTLAYLVYESREGERLGFSIGRANGLSAAAPLYFEGPVTAALWTAWDRAVILTGRGGREVLEPVVETIRAREAARGAP